MKTVLICNQKGGVGKTMIADEIAFAFDKSNTPYNFYDLDSQGGSLHDETQNENALVSYCRHTRSITREYYTMDARCRYNNHTN